MKRAAKKCGLNDIMNKELSLFKLNGARVLDNEITISGRQRSWTLGNYLQLLKKSPSAVKMGVGHVMTSDCGISSTSDKVHNNNDLLTY